MTNSQHHYAVILSLPDDLDLRLRRWAEGTRGATWDSSGGHVTLARLAGESSVSEVNAALLVACRGVAPFEAEFSQPVRAPYWDKPGLEIVMLVGAEPAQVAPVLALRQRILDALLPLGLALYEPGEYVPHVTLTTGQPEAEATALERAAAGLNLRFSADKVVLWSNEDVDLSDSPWTVVDRLALSG